MGISFDIPEIFLSNGRYEINEKTKEEFIRILLYKKRIAGLNDIISANNYFFRNNLLTDKANIFYNSFDINDNLVLRTCYLFLKAALLFHTSHYFGEDALANFYFGLEGCLRLIFKKRYKNENFNIDKAKAIINEVFPNEYYVEALEDFYKDRITIIHPEPKYDSTWLPPYYSDDFMDNYEWLLNLLYFAITGEKR